MFQPLSTGGMVGSAAYANISRRGGQGLCNSQGWWVWNVCPELRTDPGEIRCVLFLSDLSELRLRR